MLAAIFDFGGLLFVGLMPLTTYLGRKVVERSRPPDSYLRATGFLRCRTVFGHPRFGAAMAEGAKALKARLWTPRNLAGFFDLTPAGLRWVPADHLGATGFQPFVIPWQELSRVRVRRVIPGSRSERPSFFRRVTEQAYVTLEGDFGPSIEAQFLPFTPFREELEKRGISIHG